jgi:pimeloyl-ACP methyl ester carboxylesterase
MAQFADDLAAFLDYLGIEQAVVGGISMGAGTALNFALRYPERIRGLVLSRPAWLDQTLPPNLRLYCTVAALIRMFGPARGLVQFKQSTEYLDMVQSYPATAQSFVSQFQQPRAAEAVARLERIPRDAPNLDRRDWSSIQVPTPVLANRQDPVHPFDYGVLLAQSIPGAELKEVKPKSVSEEQHMRDVRVSIDGFLTRRILQYGVNPC